ncbi:MAG: hypothetical protein ACR2MN_17030 [Acidimicrobiales bacterium]
MSAREAWLGRLDPAVLHHLAAAAEGEAHRRRWAPVIDPATTASELADLLANGEHPSLGWWRIRVARHTPGAAGVPTAETVALVTAELVAATTLSDEEVTAAMTTVAKALGVDAFTANRAARAGCEAGRRIADDGGPALESSAA